MVWNSLVLTSIFDVLFIAVACIAAYFLATHLRTINVVGAKRDRLFIVTGLAVWVSIYVADLVILLIGPMFFSQREALAAIRFLHQDARWFIDIAAGSLLLFGIISLTRNFGKALQSMQTTMEVLGTELDSRTSRQLELKAEVLTQRASNRSKSEFLVGLSHELRTPLNGIIGLAGLLANTELANDQRKLLTTLEQSAQAMLARVNDVLDLSKLESGHVELRAVAFRPSELVKSVDALFSPLANEKGLAVTTHTSETARRYVIGDALLIKQVLCNLASNAVKFTPAGSIQIISDVSSAGKDRLWLSFTVIDSGVGLGDEDVERLSKPGGAGQVGEPGLGLSICWRLAQLMDGDLTIESELGAGSTFTVRLQVQREPRTEAAEVVT